MMGKKKESQVADKKHIKKIQARKAEKNTLLTAKGGDGCVPVR